MIEEPPLLRLKAITSRPSKTSIAILKSVPTAAIADCMNGRGALDMKIAPLGHHRHVFGPALPVDCQPGDVLPLLAAPKLVKRGDIVICAVQGHQGCAAAGDMVAGMLTNAGVAALITDGPLRDAAGITETGLPCWSTGLTPASPVSTGPGAVGHPIQIGGQRVAGGDIIVADRDGVVVIPSDQLAAVLEKLPHVLSLERALEAEVRGGRLMPDAITALLDSDQVVWDSESSSGH
jgi:regulator of RNase E activity RraA